MSRVLLLQLDGKLPNIALMRLAAHHQALGDTVELRQLGNVGAVQRELGDAHDLIYGSLIFTRTQPLAKRVREQFPGVVLGGTGSGSWETLEARGITTTAQDYTLYPKFTASIGFTQRGCRLKCGFCVVPKKEGAIRTEQTIADLYRGEPWPRHLILLDNDFFGQREWAARIEEIKAGGFKVSFNQGINARMLTDETAAAIASVAYYDDQFRTRRIYTAWDNRKDEHRLFRGLAALVRHGVKPDHIMVYILIGYWPGETVADWDYRRAQLRAFGARPYPMPFVRTAETVGFQRWVIGAYDKRVAWADWVAARYEPRRLFAERYEPSAAAVTGG
jgi:hypothetical protein